MNKLTSTKSQNFFVLLMGSSLLLQLVLSLFLTDNVVAFWLVNGSYSVGLFVVAMVYLRLAKTPLLSSIKADKLPKLTDTLLLFVAVTALICAMVPINDWLVELVVSWGGSVSSITPSQLYDNFILTIVVTCVVVPISEEVCFRGIIGNGLAEKNKIFAVLVSSCLFSLFHLNMAQTLHQFVLGCILMVYVVTTGSLYVAIFGHAFNNAMVLLLDRWVYPTGVFSSYAWLFITFGLAIVAVIVSLHINKNKDKFACNGERVVIAPLFIVALVCVVALWVSSGVS